MRTQFPIFLVPPLSHDNLTRNGYEGHSRCLLSTTMTSQAHASDPTSSPSTFGGNRSTPSTTHSVNTSPASHHPSPWKRMVGRLSRKNSVVADPSISYSNDSPLHEPPTNSDLFSPHPASPGPQNSLYNNSNNSSSANGFNSPGPVDKEGGYFDPQSWSGAKGVANSSPAPSQRSWKANTTSSSTTSTPLSKENLRSSASKMTRLGSSSGKGTDKFRSLGRSAGRGHPGSPQTADPTQSSFRITSGPAPSGSGSKEGGGHTLPRFLRRVASAPNTKALFSGGLFSASNGSSASDKSYPYPPSKNGFLSPNSQSSDQIPPLPTGVIPVGDLHDSGVSMNGGSSQGSTSKFMMKKKTSKSSAGSDREKSTSSSNRSSSIKQQSTEASNNSPTRSRSSPTIANKSPSLLAPPSPNPGTASLNNGGLAGSPRAAFRRTYSSSSIRVRNREVGPSSFQKIKLLGKGDVGKVYLVREKQTQTLYAMKVLSKKEMIKRNKIKRALAEEVRYIHLDLGKSFAETDSLHWRLRKFSLVRIILSSLLSTTLSSPTTTFTSVSTSCCFPNHAQLLTLFSFPSFQAWSTAWEESSFELYRLDQASAYRKKMRSSTLPKSSPLSNTFT